MSNKIKTLWRGKRTHDTEKTERFDRERAERALAFHKSFLEYAQTPLWDLTCLARELGVASIYVKDESWRFGLNAFKVLGGTYCIGNYLARQLQMDISEVSFGLLTSKAIREKLGEITFVTATDGNHGRGPPLDFCAPVGGQAVLLAVI